MIKVNKHYNLAKSLVDISDKNLIVDHIIELRETIEEYDEKLNYAQECLLAIYKDHVKPCGNECNAPNGCDCIVNICQAGCRKITGKSIEEIIKDE